jgi:hypothetical protein
LRGIHKRFSNVRKIKGLSEENLHGFVHFRVRIGPDPRTKESHWADMGAVGTQYARISLHLLNTIRRDRMKTFFEYFLDEVARKQEAGELDADKAQRWVAELQGQLHAYAQDNPTAPLVQMPVQH